MSITVNLRYKGKNGSARAFAEEMTTSGTVEAIRKEEAICDMSIIFPSMTRRQFC